MVFCFNVNLEDPGRAPSFAGPGRPLDCQIQEDGPSVHLTWNSAPHSLLQQLTVLPASLSVPAPFREEDAGRA